MHYTITPANQFDTLEALRELLAAFIDNSESGGSQTRFTEYRLNPETLIEKAEYQDETNNLFLIICETNTPGAAIPKSSIAHFAEELSIFAAGRSFHLAKKCRIDEHPDAPVNLLIAFIFPEILDSTERGTFAHEFKEWLYEARHSIEAISTPRRFDCAPGIGSSRVFVPTTLSIKHESGSPLDKWRALLADPELHWKEGRSAYCLANSWESAQSSSTKIPHEVNRLLKECLRTKAVELLLAFPEWCTAMPAKGKASQTDLFCLVRTAEGELATVGVEGKVTESFGPYVSEWLKDASSESSLANRTKRITKILSLFGTELPEKIYGQLRYQLFHRTAAAVYEAQRFNCQHAVMLVHSFDPSTEQAGANDYQDFLAALNAEGDNKPGTTASIPLNRETALNGSLKLHLAWARGAAESRDRIPSLT